MKSLGLFPWLFAPFNTKQDSMLLLYFKDCYEALMNELAEDVSRIVILPVVSTVTEVVLFMFKWDICSCSVSDNCCTEAFCTCRSKLEHIGWSRYVNKTILTSCTNFSPVFTHLLSQEESCCFVVFFLILFYFLDFGHYNFVSIVKNLELLSKQNWHLEFRHS